MKKPVSSLRRYAAASAILLLLNGCTNDTPGVPRDTTVDPDSTPITTVVPDTTSAPNTTAVPVTTVPVTTAAPEPAGLGATAVCTLKGLPTNRAVQQFVFVRDGDTLNLFVTQRISTTTYLTRCVVSDDGTTATAADHIALEGYGHAESLDVSVREDGSFYLYLGSDANDLNTYAWATTITRLRYENGTISDEKTITGVECATANGAPLNSTSTPYRINFATDNESDLLVLYLRLDTKHTGKQAGHYLVTYRLSAIDALLDAAESGISLADADAADAYLASSGKQALESICHNESFQGLEVDAEGNIYITGGSTAIQPQLSRFAAENGVIRRKKVSSFNWIVSDFLRNRNFSIARSYVEIESIKYFEGNLYCSFCPGSADIPNNTEIFLLGEK